MNKGDLENEVFTVEQTDNSIHVVCSGRRFNTPEEIIKECNIDTNIWELTKIKTSTHEGYRKDRSVEWDVEDGNVTHGKVRDSGKMLVVPLKSFQLTFTKLVNVAKAKSAIEAMIEDAKAFSPAYEKINYIPLEEGNLAEIDIFDLHLGRLTWGEESGEDYDLKIARKVVMSVVNKLASRLTAFNISRIVFPLGNDFFNVDGKDNATTKGTPQQEDTRWQKTFRAGRETAVEIIDTLSLIAPVDVIIVPGNHDEQRSFYLGDSLHSWYRNSQDVTIDNCAKHRKYYQFENNLIGFTHGSDEKLDKLPLLMALEEPNAWAKTKFREWHLGHLHNRKGFLSPDHDEGTGVMIRLLSSLASQDAWTFNSGYKSLRASQGFIWTPKDGLCAQFTALPDIPKKQ
jgi:hypothetical protein